MKHKNLEIFNYKGSDVARVVCSQGELCERPCGLAVALIRLSEIKTAQVMDEPGKIVDALTYSGAICPSEAKIQSELLMAIEVDVQKVHSPV